MNRLLDWITLFSSASTLICCALPATLVMLGAGSVMASLAVNVPGLIWLSSHKTLLFTIAAVLIAFGGWLQLRARKLPCPTEPALAYACMRTRKTSLIIYWFSLGLFLTGGFFAFVAPRLM